MQLNECFRDCSVFNLIAKIKYIYKISTTFIINCVLYILPYPGLAAAQSQNVVHMYYNKNLYLVHVVHANVVHVVQK